jgi:hypothetical protein
MPAICRQINDEYEKWAWRGIDDITPVNAGNRPRVWPPNSGRRVLRGAAGPANPEGHEDCLR